MYNSLFVRFLAVLLSLTGFAVVATAQTAKESPPRKKGNAAYPRYPGDGPRYQPTKSIPSTSAAPTNSRKIGPNEGSESIKNDYARSSSFADKNNAFGGFFANGDKKTNLFTRLENQMRSGTDPRTTMDSAFGDYILKGISRYEDRGQRVVFAPVLTALDKSLAIYRATSGADVPQLKDSILAGRTKPKGTNKANIHLIDVYVHPDQLTRDQLLAKVGPKAFTQIYSEQLKDAKANPVVLNLTVKNEADATTLRNLVIEMYGTSLNDIPRNYWPLVGYNADGSPIPRLERIAVLKKEDAPNLAKRLVALYGTDLSKLPEEYRHLVSTTADGKKVFSINKGQSIDLVTTDQSTNLSVYNKDRPFTLGFFNGSPGRPKLFPNPNWVVIEFDPRNMQLYSADQASSVYESDSNRFIRVYENLDQVTDQHIAYALAVHTSVSNFDELQTKMSNAVRPKMPKEASSILSSLETQVYELCADCAGVSDESPAPSKKASGKKVPAKPTAKTQR